MIAADARPSDGFRRPSGAMARPVIARPPEMVVAEPPDHVVQGTPLARRGVRWAAWWALEGAKLVLLVGTGLVLSSASRPKLPPTERAEAQGDGEA